MELEYKQDSGRIEPFFMEMHLEQFHRKQLLLGTIAIAERTIFSFVTTTTKCLAPASHPLSLGCQGNFSPSKIIGFYNMICTSDVINLKLANW